MGKILSAYLCPHPPVIIHDIGKGREQEVNQTIQAMNTVSINIKNKNPDTIIVISPHGPVYRDVVSISDQRILKGDLSKFGARHIALSYQNDLELVDNIMLQAQKRNIPCVALNKTYYYNSADLDHGVLLPLYFIDKQFNQHKLVRISIGMLSYHELYSFGKAIQQAVQESDRSVVIIASGDLSHRLTLNAPAGFHPDGKVFDKKLVQMIRDGDVQGVLDMDSQLVDNAGECGLIPIIIMLGALDGYKFETQILSYEGPFGVGYCVASLDSLKKDSSRNFLDKMSDQKYDKHKYLKHQGDEYVALARLAVETYIKSAKMIDVPCNISDELINKKAGVFVSIKKQGQLRGCIGTIKPVYDNIAQEIIHNAISAATRDYRFYPIKPGELEQLNYSVDVLMPPEPITSIHQLDVKKYGVIVKSGYKTGLLLPDIEGVDTPKQQIEIALKKAGIKENEPYDMQRFEVVRHEEQR